MTHKPTALDRRIDKRLPHGRLVTVRVFESPDTEPGEEFQGLSVDVSPEGACIEGPRRLPADVWLELGLRFEGFPGEFLHWAQLRWIQPVPERDAFRMGLNFSRMSPTVKAVWSGFLECVQRRDGLSP